MPALTMDRFQPEAVSLDQVRGVIRDGPAPSAHVMAVPTAPPISEAAENKEAAQ
jgi:hypothetical protein